VSYYKRVKNTPLHDTFTNHDPASRYLSSRAIFTLSLPCPIRPVSSQPRRGDQEEVSQTGRIDDGLRLLDLNNLSPDYPAGPYLLEIYTHIYMLTLMYNRTAFMLIAKFIGDHDCQTCNNIALLPILIMCRNRTGGNKIEVLL
jgi:hypothetical protein